MTLEEAVHRVISASTWRVVDDKNGSSHMSETIEVPFGEFVQMMRALNERERQAA